MVLPTNETEIESAPSSIGAYPPATEPIIIPIIMKLFLDIVFTNELFYDKLNNIIALFIIFKRRKYTISFITD
ncbi:MAG: hypothetical protein CVU62_08660 [Deltaproteobacteria bacterium HGW-Deltaproteobacteria-2]|nr:MAG: hypothetical protein CVU62_08660 [Deltaproteobacteria bacterium HGW-Deltaproteobacteria-2]